MLRRSLFLLPALLPVAAGAQTWPSRPIRLIVTFAPGGGADFMGRTVAPLLGEQLGQTVVVENRAGANGVVGADIAAKAAPDGYTLLMGTNTTHAVAPHLYGKMPYNALKDFVPIAEVAYNPQFLDVHPSIPVRNVKELIVLAQKRPGQLNFGSAGQGSASHMAMELFKSMAKVDITHVPYKGSGPALVDVLGGHLSMMFDVVLTTLPHMKAGRLRVLGVSSLQRVEVAPDVPTIAENGLPGFEALVWFGLFAPAGTPPEIVGKLSGEVGKIVHQPALRETFTLQGLTPVGSNSPQFAAKVGKDYATWGKVIREAGIKLD